MRKLSILFYVLILASTSAKSQSNNDFLAALLEIEQLLDSTETDAALDLGLANLKKLEGISDTLVGRFHQKMSLAWMQKPENDKALASSQRFLNIFQKQLGDNHQESALAHLHHAQMLDWDSQFEASLAMAQTALTILEKSDNTDSLNFASIYYQIGGTDMKLSNKPEALKNLKKAWGIQQRHTAHPDKIGSTLARISQVYRMMGNFEEAIRHLELEIELFKKHYGDDYGKIGLSLVDLGYIYLTYGEVEKAIEVLQNSLNYDHRNTGFAYNSLGNCFRQLGEFEKSLDYFHEAESILAKQYGKNSVYLSWIYNNMGLAYYAKKDYAASIQNHQKELDIAQKVYGNNHPNVAYALNCLGAALLKDGQANKALELHEKSLPIWIAAEGERGMDLEIYYRGIGDVYFQLKDFEKAEQFYQDGLELYMETRWESSPYLAVFYNKLAQIRLAKGDTAGAKGSIEDGLQVLNISNLENSEFDQVVEIQHLLPLLETGGKIYRSQGDKFLVQANQYHDAAIDLMAYLQSGYQDNHAKEVLRENWYHLYERAIETKLKIDPNNWNSVFEIAEKSKAQTLLNALSESRYRSFLNISEELLDEERKVKKEITTLQNQLHESKNDSLSTVLRQQIFEQKEKWYALRDKIKTEYPRFYQLSYEQDVISAEDIQTELLDPQTALIEYFMGDSMLYIFLIQQDARFIFNKKIDNNFNKDFLAVNKWLNKKIERPTAALDDLSKLLIEPVLKELNPNISNLIIIPDGQLGYLPFETLPIKNNDKISLLFEKYNCRYAYSASLLLEQNNIILNKASRQFAGFAPTYPEQINSSGSEALSLLLRSGNLPLPGAQKEVNMIAAIMDGDAFSGEQATESQFKKQATDYQILHLSMHALLDDNNPLFAHLLFTPETDSLNDGSLTVAELYNQDLNAALAVLSACNTGYGQVKRGEGIMSLSRAFTYAGVPSTVMSLWKVPDDATAQIMVAFYEKLKEGRSKSEALQLAKKAYLDNALTEELRHPFYWAGFVLAGNDAAVVWEGSNLKWWGFLLAGLVLIVFLLFFWINKKGL